ncbi:MAG: ORF6N domain-containing protein [Lentisphaerae bacterium]|nr:ORF6N domain-containing protein [Lentisphaerota bacterium]
MNNELIKRDGIAGKIYQIRGAQVMLDRDLAELYETETRTLKQTVKRNVDRFPSDFMFELSDEDIDLLVSQSVIPSKKHLGGAVPYAFTEQGVSMLSSILRTPLAVEISIKIMRAFVAMRHFVQENAVLFREINQIKIEQVQLRIDTERKFEQVFNALEAGDEPPKQGVFFNGQIFDAYRFVNDLIRQAKQSIILIDNYVDDTVLEQLAKRRKGVSATIFTKTISKRLALDVEKHNQQYPAIAIQPLAESHDRFLLIDDNVYHIGASLKDLGKKWFAFSKMDQAGLKVIDKIRSLWPAENN